MEFARTKAEQERKAYKCGVVLIGFLNSEKVTIGAKELVDKAIDDLDLPIKPLIRVGLKKRIISDCYSDLVDIFGHVISCRQLSDSKKFMHYMDMYNAIGNKWMYIDDEDNYFYYSAIGEDSTFDDIIIYLVIEFFRIKRHKELIGICSSCNKYHLYKQKGNHKFCSNKCRNKYHGDKRIASGKAAEYKRKRRAQGLDM
ncbi:hypothetical protein SAMN02745216_04267 [Desulfatibacillum alkenivorans DSM 16219]|jgi:hypothetical protein|uniref:Uncharacterized protein n=1 Tax=Desulfatibacillum alkenivorans DSM 16219 TaxID=1121393 RepID=A0A1M6W7R1_9BACT|nr:hypothetical protein [Desulfatibacillum alkenivorans]SHK89525.1 hypothetical protein SAMN02745216_04267 [Desulfatibacillum alkenivorans DSM 16219]